jgi:hypothetical protein
MATAILEVAIKPLKAVLFQGFSVISQGLKGLQKIHFLRFRNIHTRMTVNQHCPEKINSTGGDKRRSLWYNGAEYKKGGI